MQGTSCLIFSQTSGENPLSVQKYPDPITPKILSIEAFDGRVQLNIENCRFKRSGISFLPPPGWIIAATNCISTILVKSPGFSRL